MKKAQRRIGPVALLVLLVLLALLTLLAVKRRHVTTEEATDETVRAVVKIGFGGGLDSLAGVALLALIALFAFVTWTALRANEEEAKAMPPARESSASGTTGVPLAGYFGRASAGDLHTGASRLRP